MKRKSVCKSMLDMIGDCLAHYEMYTLNDLQFLLRIYKKKHRGGELSPEEIARHSKLDVRIHKDNYPQ